MRSKALLSGLAAVGVAFAITAACESGTPADPMVEEPAAASIVPVTSSTAEEITESTVLYACYNPSGTVYRIKEPGLPDECLAPSHVEFSWNAEGPPGPAGADGKHGLHCWDLNENGVADLPDEDANGDKVVDVLDCKGDQGDPGPQGPAGVSGLEVVTQIETAPVAISSHSASLQALVDCPGDKKVLGGGGSNRLVSGGSGFAAVGSRMQESRPAGTDFLTGWVVRFHLTIENAGPGIDHEVKAWAICANVSP